MPEPDIIITGKEYEFDPARIRAEAGEKITIEFRNEGVADHTLTVEELDISTGPVEQGESKQITFQVPEDASGKELRFSSSVPGMEEHGMVGEIVVE